VLNPLKPGTSRHTPQPFASRLLVWHQLDIAVSTNLRVRLTQREKERARVGLPVAEIILQTSSSLTLDHQVICTLKQLSQALPLLPDSPMYTTGFSSVAPMPTLLELPLRRAASTADERVAALVLVAWVASRSMVRWQPPD
jgi:hypothetical protein